MIRAIGKRVYVFVKPLLFAASALAFPVALEAQTGSVEIRPGLESYEVEDVDRPAGTGEVGAEALAGEWELTLDRAIHLALEHNLTIGVRRYEHTRALVGIMRDLGIYDLQLDVNASKRSNSRLSRSFFELADLIREETDQGNLSLSQLTPFGGTAQFDFQNQRFESTNEAEDPNPRYNINLDLSFTQPLLRNFGRSVTEQNLIVTRRNAAISREDFQAQVEQVVQQVIDSYWDLVGAQKQLEVAQESLGLAEELDGMNRIQVRVGTLAPLEVIQSEAGVAARKEDIITFQAQVDDAADTLRSLIHLEETDLWDVAIRPSTEPAVSDHREINVDEALRTALAHRPDVRRRHLVNDNLELDARVARNQTKPRVDLTAQYGYNALAGFLGLRDDDGQFLVDDMGDVIRIPAGYDEAVQQLADRRFKDVTVSLQVSYPLQNRDARARAIEADLARQQGKLELRQLALQVRTEVRRTARAVEAAFQRVETAKVSSHLAQKNLEAEQKRYENGLSTSFEVLRIQEDLSEARRREVSALINYRRAQASFDLSVGKLLESYGVRLAEDE